VLAAFVMSVCSTLFTHATYALDMINVGYFLEWATPSLIAKAEKTYDKALGADMNWVAFESGTQMTDAMLAGDIDIAYSQGLVPFLTAINAGAEIITVGVAVEYPAIPCIVGQHAGISSGNARALEGGAVALPRNSMADYSYRMQMETLNVDMSRVDIIDKLPAEAAQSLIDEEVSMSCLWGADTIRSAKQHGKILLNEQELVDAGIISFDVVTVTKSFAAQNPFAVESFMQVTDAINKAYARDQSKIGIIAQEAGLEIDAARNQMSRMIFPTVEDQLIIYFNKSGLADDTIGMVGNVFATVKIPALQSYRSAIDTSFLK